ncbi:MAG: Rdx family protein [Anaerolineae bacterium]|nr:Rdx family protein [Anaerolineae bacterium]
MTDEILKDRQIEAFVRSFNLLPASGGKFEVTLNGELIFSKKKLGRHAEPGEIKALIMEKLEAIRPPGVVIEEDD